MASDLVNSKNDHEKAVQKKRLFINKYQPKTNKKPNKGSVKALKEAKKNTGANKQKTNPKRAFFIWYFFNISNTKIAEPTLKITLKNRAAR